MRNTVDLPRVAEDTPLTSIRPSGMNASLWAKKAIAGDVGVAEMREILHKVLWHLMHFLHMMHTMHMVHLMTFLRLMRLL